jgi:hypothetical protein
MKKESAMSETTGRPPLCVHVENRKRRKTAPDKVRGSKKVFGQYTSATGVLQVLAFTTVIDADGGQPATLNQHRCQHRHSRRTDLDFAQSAR